MPENVTVENYYQLRNEIVDKNQNFLGIILREEEKELDKKLRNIIKNCEKEYGDNIPCNKPILMIPDLWRTELYSFCKSLPKGADLHVHGTSLMPVWKLIKFLSKRDDILIDIETLILKTKDNATKNCMTVRDALDEGLIDRPTLEKKWTVSGIKDDEDAWKYFEALFEYQDAIDSDLNILYDYYVESFTDAIKNGIFHIELHVVLSGNLEKTLKTVKCIREAYYAVRREYNEFSVRIIGSSMKMFDFSIEETSEIFKNTIEAQKTVLDEFDEIKQNFVIGFDLVNEEDTSRALKEYAPLLLKCKEEHPDFKFFLHCGESINSYNDNLIDAYLLGSTRVGHGTNLYRYPHLLRLYAKNEICLEVCPISNQTLRYTHDLRLHPGAEYLKRGVSIALCSDDPVYQEHEQLTDDFFACIVAWGLGVAEIKQLCINSIMFSATDEESKRRLLRHWNKSWKEFVKKQLEI